MTRIALLGYGAVASIQLGPASRARFRSEEVRTCTPYLVTPVASYSNMETQARLWCYSHDSGSWESKGVDVEFRLIYRGPHLLARGRAVIPISNIRSVR